MKLFSHSFYCLKGLLILVSCVCVLRNSCDADCSVLNNENAWNGCCTYDSRNHVLECNNPSITDIKKGTFSSDKLETYSVHQIWIHGTNIKRIESGVFGKGISNISIYENPNLENIDKDAFSDVSEGLLYLTITENLSLKNLPEGIFDGCDKLLNLQLYRNNINNLSSTLFKDLSSLTYLNISVNNLVSLPNDIFAKQGSQLNVDATYNCLNKSNIDKIVGKIKSNSDFSKQRVCLIPIYDYYTEVKHPVIAKVGLTGNENLIANKYAGLLDDKPSHKFIQNGSFNFDVSSLEHYESKGSDDGIANYPSSGKLYANVSWIMPNIVTFHSNGGTDVNVGSEKNKWYGYYGFLVNGGKEPLISRTGYIFSGWFEDDVTFGRYWKFNEYIIGNINTDGTYGESDVDLYAKWEPKKYQISFEYNGGILTGDWKNKNITGMTVTFGQEIGDGLPNKDVVYKTGYTFKSVDNIDRDGVNNPTYNSDTIYDIDGNTVGSVQWIANQYNIQYILNGGSIEDCNDKICTCNSDDCDQVIYYDDRIASLKVPKKEGYTFVTWIDKNNNVINLDKYKNGYKITDDIKLIASWKLTDYTISFDTNGGSLVPSITTGYLLPIIWPDDPIRIGYTFVGWFNKSGDIVNTGLIDNMPLNGLDLVAHWDVNKYQLDFNFNGGTGKSLPKTVIFGQPIGDIPNTTKTGYSLVGRKIGNTFIDSNTKYTLNKDSTAIAQWIDSTKRGGGEGGGGGGGGGGGEGGGNGGGGGLDGGQNNGGNENGDSLDREELYYANSLPIASADLNEELDEYHIAHMWAYKKGLTSFENFDDARMFDDLTRAEMAKISSIFAIKFFNKVPNTSTEKIYECSQYLDLGEVNEELQSYIIQSCELGYMGYLSNGLDYLDKFRPQDNISRAEVSIVFSRIMWGNTYAGDEEHWYQKHLQAMFDQGIVHNIKTPFKNEIRGDVYIMLSRINHVQ